MVRTKLPNYCSMFLQEVYAEVDVSEQYEVDPETGKATHYIDVSEGEPERVGEFLSKDTWRYYCPDCNLMTHDWAEVKETHLLED